MPPIARPRKSTSGGSPVSRSKPHPDTFPAFFEEAWDIVEKGN